ncbi:vWA domain-containing protein [Pontibacter sp. 13R65]|uniref:vWA domain-containing protein n=1 Tax=Pontibacter sp. 13R65 TaxID=3127458 RepID=UPI00301DF2F1
MTWYQTITFLEILFGALFLGVYIGYLMRVRKVALFFKQRPHIVWFKFVLRHVYVLLLVIAILGPSFGAMKKEIKTIGKDLYIAVDLSESMNATDVQPSRIEKARHEMQRLISRFNSDKIGIIVFSSEAFLHTPLTFDQEALQLYTRTLRTDLLPSSGTDFTPVLQLALEKFTQNQTADTEQQKARVLVLISDGEDFGERRQRLIDELREQNIRVFALGIGTPDGGRIPVPGGYKKDNNGQVVYTRLNPEALLQLADQTDGEYFEVDDRVSEVNRLISSINNIEGELRESKTVDVTANKYIYPLALAFFLILVDILIPVKLISV